MLKELSNRYVHQNVFFSPFQMVITFEWVKIETCFLLCFPCNFMYFCTILFLVCIYVVHFRLPVPNIRKERSISVKYIRKERSISVKYIRKERSISVKYIGKERSISVKYKGGGAEYLCKVYKEGAEYLCEVYKEGAEYLCEV